MTDKQRIADLERRLAEAEARIAMLEAVIHMHQWRNANPRFGSDPWPLPPLEVTCADAPQMRATNPAPHAAAPLVPSQSSTFTVR